MTGQVLPFDPSAHKVADVLLPWFVNGTLEGDQLAFVQQHVRECSQCQREVEWLRELHAACAAAEDVPAAAKAARHLRSQLDAPRSTQGVPARARGGLRTEARWAIAGAFAALIAVTGVWVADGENPALYRTLGARDTAPVTSGSLVVVFDPATTEFDLRRILRAADARIVDGPTQTNAYVLAVPAAKRERALSTLRAERGVMLAERLDAGAKR